MEYVDKLASDLRSGRISRRAFVRRVTALGVSGATAATIAREALAQSSTPESSPGASPVTDGEVKMSMTREEYLTQLYQNFPMSDPASTGGQIIFPSTVDMSTLNPHIRADVAALYIIAPMFSNLIASAPWDTSVFGPDLADYWTESADGLTYTFYLNKDAKFHDGMPVTAHDVVFSYDTMISPDGLAVYQSDFARNVASYRAIDDHTFELVAAQRSALFLSSACAGLCVLPKHIWEGIPLLEWGSAPGATGADPTQVIGSGMFRFLEWVGDDHATIVRNDDYFLPELIPNIDTFTFRVIPETSAALQAFQTGEVDITGVPADQVESVQSGDPEATIVTFDTWRHEFVAPNIGKGKLFAELPVRQALYYSIDRELILSEILQGYGVVADGPQPPPSPAYAPDRMNTIYRFDPDKARQLLDEAGWVDSDGDGVREKGDLKLQTNFYYIDSPLGTTLVTYLQQAWLEVGISVELVSEPQPTLLERLFKGDFDLSLVGATWINMGDQGALYTTAGFPPNGFNLSFWSNEQYDALQEQQLVELDPDKRREILIEMSNIMNDDAAVILLCFTQSIVATKARVHNAYPNASGLTWSLPWMWVDPQ